MKAIDLVIKLVEMINEHGNVEVKYFDTSSYDYDRVDDTRDVSELFFNEDANRIEIC